MPKKKIETTKENSEPLPKPIEEIEEEKIIDPDGILGDESADDEDETTMDDDEVDPFGDKYEQ